MDRLVASTCGSRIAQMVARWREHASEPAGHAHDNAERADSSHAGRLQVHALTQWIARGEHGNQAARQRMDDGDFYGQMKVAYARGKRCGLVQELPGAEREIAQALAQGRRACRMS